jgi:hypothetical protein
MSPLRVDYYDSPEASRDSISATEKQDSRH